MIKLAQLSLAISGIECDSIFFVGLYVLAKAQINEQTSTNKNSEVGNTS